ncbi:MAG: DNA polymerase III subunit gamma/tau [Clostridiales bacterium]|nr:DNA polymerase III subunit gamma/tau [Clostridiales bacterium]
MAYVALYRKFRPNSFSELVGQEHIVRTLSNQLESGRIAHAYLFAGPRGTGKTSTAKLFAKAINCCDLQGINPCLKCPACIQATADDNMDIIEIDAASNNGVDNIRDIRDKVVFAPTVGKYKVYIIDEVHMLSGGAFNALLKTLEEPPKHAVFILATTEIHKLPATILSRCQRFDFKLISTDVIFERLKYVLEQSGAEFEDSAIDLIAKSASGGMRDALSLADVCLSYCGNKVTYEDAKNVLGISDRSFVFSFADALIASDISLALEKCRELETQGKDIGVFALELMEHMRDIMLAVFAPKSAQITALPKDIQEKLFIQAKNANTERILRSIEILSALECEIKLHSKPNIQLETAVARICSPQIEQDLSALIDRVAVLEEKLKNGVCINSEKEQVKEKPEHSKQDTPPWDIPSEQPEPKAEKVPPVQKKQTQATNETSSYFKAFIDKVKQTDMPLYMMLRNFDGAIENNKFVLYIPQSAQSKEAIISKHSELLSSIIKEVTGQDLTVIAKVGAKPQTQQTQSVSNMDAALDLFS